MDFGTRQFVWTDWDSHQSAVCPPPLSSFLPTSGAELHSCDLLSSIFMERLSPRDSNLVNVDTPTTAWPPGLTLLVTGAWDEEEEEEEVAEEKQEKEEEEEEAEGTEGDEGDVEAEKV